MRAFRLASRHHDPFTGDGAARYGGRWNSRGRSVVYASRPLSLAVLETLVHVERTGDLPDDRRFWAFALPDEHVDRLDRDRLGEGWQEDRNNTRALGDAWFESRRSVGLLVPSAVVPVDRNLLVNPEHPRIDALEVLEAEDFIFDPRLAAG